MNSARQNQIARSSRRRRWRPSGLLVTVVAATLVFAGSLAAMARNAELAEVLMVGMIVPSFTWVVQITASGIGLPYAICSAIFSGTAPLIAALKRLSEAMM